MVTGPAHEHLPGGERSVVRYDLRSVDGGTLLTLTHSRLTKRTALGLALGTHALLDRLEASLASQPYQIGWRGTKRSKQHVQGWST
jgi:hypothetical protein